MFTDENGFYSASGLLPGVYSIKAYSPSFLPALRERVGLRPGSSVMVNLKLSGLFEAIQLPAMRGPADDDDDWKWVLRSASNRPILRMLDDGSLLPAAESGSDKHDLKGTLSFVAGSASGGFGSSSDMSTGFSVERSLFSSGTMALQGNVGYGNGGSPNTVLRASYSHSMANGSKPEMAFTMRRLAAPGINGYGTALQALALSASDEFSLGDILELRFGSELQTIQFLGRVTAFRPFGSADLHLSPNTVLEYRYATSEPDSRMEKGFDSAPADLSESGPRVSLAGFSSTVERAHHHELSLSHRAGDTNLQIAMYSDRVADPALTGVGDASADSGDVLPDIYSETFTYRGKELDARGMRVVLQRKLASDLTATLDYGYGGVLDLSKTDIALQDARRDSLCAEPSHRVGEIQRHAAGHQDALDYFLPLDQRAGADAGGYVQRVGGTVRSLSEHLPAPAHPRNRFPARPHGCGRGYTQSSGPGICSRHGSGWAHGVSGAVRPLDSRRRGVYLLDVSLQSSV